MLGLGSISGIAGMMGLGSMNGTSSSLMSIFSGSIGGSSDSLENMAMKFMTFWDGGQSKTKIKNVKMQTRMYGTVIPEIFGKMRVSGNIIWHSPIVSNTVYSAPQISKTGDIGGGGSTTTVRASFAIALGNGVIDGVDAIYANEIAVNLSGLNYIVYNGDENQMPNSIMQAYLGADNVPAYRGLAYIVFDNFPLENYNGSLPNFTFDVRRTNFLPEDLTDRKKPEQMIAGVNIIPATGEAVYDTVVQYRHQMIRKADLFGNIAIVKATKGMSINQNTAQDKADFLVSLDQMKSTMPNIKWVSLVVAWFSDSLDISVANVYPAHENVGYETFPDNWKVGSFTRDNARVVGRDSSGMLRYGGTVSDVSVVRALKELKSRGYNVCLYPMIFLDTEQKPWRGRMTGSANGVDIFFSKDSGYNKFIKHYANLGKDLIDAFIIGSEMVGITKICNTSGQFVGVDRFVDLAKDAKVILGKNVKTTYAADWSEYHHVDGGWYNMDKLWSCDSIDFIGIDAYFPLTNEIHTVNDVDEIIKGWTSDEGWDFYYTDNNKTAKEKLSSSYAWKNIEFFWNNKHINPDGKQTAWVPRSKPIWFTEYGFPSVDCTTNSPNVFYSPGSLESGVPLHSLGLADLQAQRSAITATELKWLNSEIVKQKNIWVWDARPYPAFPALTNIWSDGPSWKYGHFLNGKLGGVGSLSEIVKYLCLQSGISEDLIDTSTLEGNVAGFALDTKRTAIEAISELAVIFEFDANVSNRKLEFKMLKNASYYNISTDEILLCDDGLDLAIIAKCNTVNIPSATEILFINPNDSYKINTISAIIDPSEDIIRDTYSFSAALTSADARRIAFQIGYSKISSRKEYKFKLSTEYSAILPMDIITFVHKDENHVLRVSSVSIINETDIEIIGVSCVLDEYKSNISILEDNDIPVADNISQVIDTELIPLDINNIDNSIDSGDSILYLAAQGIISNIQWNGCQIFASFDNEKNYNFVTSICCESIIGQVINILEDANPNLIDCYSKLSVLFEDSSAIKTIDFDNLINMDNLAMIGKEIINFKNIKQVDNNILEIDLFLRGRYGTEGQVSKHQAGERFILLDRARLTKIKIPSAAIGRKIYFKAVSFGASIYKTDAICIDFVGNYRRSLPVIRSDIYKNKDDFMVNFVPRPAYENSFFDQDYFASYCYNFIVKDTKENPISKIIADSNSLCYTKEMQVRDFGEIQDNISYYFE